MKDEILQILYSASSKHPNDPRRVKELAEMVPVLSRSASEAIAVLNTLDEESIDYIAPWFEDIAYRLQSQKFIECIEGLAEKYPNIPYIKDEVEYAKKMMD
jgi:hypothetical protein